MGRGGGVRGMRGMRGMGGGGRGYESEERMSLGRKINKGRNERLS